MRIQLLTLSLLAAAVACASDAAGPPDPTQYRVATAVRIVSGSDQSGTVAEPLSQPLVIRVLDQIGRVLPGQEVTFRIATGDGHFDSAVDTTDADGLAEAVWILGTDASVEHVAEAHVLSESGTGYVVEFEADALPGPFAALRIVGDTVAAIERADSLLIEVRPTDAFGNLVDEQPITWQASDPAVASVDDGLVVGLSEGSIVVNAVSGAASAGVHLFVEGTRSERYAVNADTLIAQSGRLFAAGLSEMDWGAWQLLEWTGSWSQIQIGWPSPYGLADVHVSPVGDFWGVFSTICTEGCPTYAVLRRDAGTWSETIRFGGAQRAVPLGFGTDGSVAMAYTVMGGDPGARALLFQGDGWIDLDLPRRFPGDSLFRYFTSVAIGTDGDIWLAGAVAYREGGNQPDRPLIARFDGIEWTFPAPPLSVGHTSNLHVGPDGVVYAQIFDGSIGRARVMRLQDSAVELIPTPLDSMDASLLHFAVSPTGELALTYTRAGVVGVLWSTPAGWESWENLYDSGEILPRARPVWHDGDIWFPALLVIGNDMAKHVVRLDL